MNEKLKTTIIQKLEHLSDDAGRQLVDYIEFLESKFSRSRRDQSPFEKLAENVEGTLRNSKLGDAALKSTEGVVEAAGSVARSFAAAGQAMLDELQRAVENEQAETSCSDSEEQDGCSDSGNEEDGDLEDAEVDSKPEATDEPKA